MRRPSLTQFLIERQRAGRINADLRLLIGAEPVYERMPGWSSPTKGVTEFDQLPAEAQRYVKRLEDVSGVDCAIISTGSDRRETIIKKGSAVERWLA